MRARCSAPSLLAAAAACTLARRPLSCRGDAVPAQMPFHTCPSPLLQTRFGEHVAVVGSFSGWDTQAPVQLEWGEGSVWSGEAELPVG